ncbi:MAG: DUF2332 domain-containing protein [Thermoleophilia bacterium]|nr:DUF2332 domain-containing protein [Thermoleophilia bacterium]
MARLTDVAERQREVFLEQARHCDGRSPVYADLCRRLAGEPRVARLVRGWARDVPLRLLGGLHYLVLAGEARWDGVDAALAAHEDFLRRFVAEQPVQTNEVQRSWVLLPCFLRVAERAGADALDLVELGPSAGLNLVWDRYRYAYRAGEWGEARAPLVLRGEERGPVPGSLLAQRPCVRRRLGIDRAPVDVTGDEGARLLECFVWAGQDERLRRLRLAVDAVRRDPPELVRGDFVELLPEVLASRAADALTVVFQSAALGYVDDAGRTRVRRVLRREGRRGLLAFVSAGRPRRDEPVWGLRIVVWPDGEREFVGHADYHGAWIDWERA